MREYTGNALAFDSGGIYEGYEIQKGGIFHDRA